MSSRSKGHANLFLRRIEKNVRVGAIAVTLAVSPITAGFFDGLKESHTNSRGTAYALASNPQPPQENKNTVIPEKTVVKLRKTKGFAIFIANTYSATGWCINQTCDLFVSNYHFAKHAGSSIKIKGEKVEKIYLATGPNDDGALLIPQSFGLPMMYNPLHDIVIYRLKHPIADMHSVAFAATLEEGEPVSIYSYPGGGPLTRSNGKFLGIFTDGILGFEANGIKPGSSGGLVVNSHGEAVGLVWGSLGNKVGAVPIWELGAFAKKIGIPFPDIHKPELEDIGPDIINQDPDEVIESTGAPLSLGGLDPKPILPDKYLYYDMGEILAPLPPLRGDVLHHRPQESEEIQALRRKANDLLDGLKTYISIETTKVGGDKVEEQVFQHEIRIVEGEQIFKQISDGKETHRLPVPKASLWTTFGNEWSDMPENVGTNLGLRIESMGHRALGDQTVKVFQFEAKEEDKACSWTFIESNGLWTKKHFYNLPCSGEIWTDEQLNILRISSHMRPPASTEWGSINTVMLYGRLTEPGEQPRLVPISIFQSTRDESGHENRII